MRPQGSAFTDPAKSTASTSRPHRLDKHDSVQGVQYAVRSTTAELLRLHVRIKALQLFAEDRNHINGIENFWNQAKRHLRRYNGIPKHLFHFYLKECEWRFNYRPTANLLKVLLQWIRI